MAVLSYPDAVMDGSKEQQQIQDTVQHFIHGGRFHLSRGARGALGARGARGARGCCLEESNHGFLAPSTI